MSNETILKAKLSSGGLIECWFTRRGRGARNWMFVVDEWGERLAALARKSGRAIHIEKGCTLGQGAVMVLPRALYSRLRIDFDSNEEVREAIERGEFSFDETPGVMEVVMRRLLRLQEREKAKRAQLIEDSGAPPEST